jgi:hypothetical protein
LLIENYVPEIQKNKDLDINFILKRMSVLEEKIYKIESQLQNNDQNLIQIDKNMKVVNQDFSLIADAVTQLLGIFMNIKIISPSDLDFFEFEKKEVETKEEEELAQKDNDEIPLGEVEDWEEFQKKYKKRYQ